MDKIKFLVFAIVLLLLLNLTTIGFVMFSNKNQNDFNESRRPKPREIVIKRLHFDEIQQEQYQKLINWHRAQIVKIENQINDNKQLLYAMLLNDKFNEKQSDSLINNLADYQKQIEATHFKHFQDIKKLCKKEQLNDFNDLTEELSKIFNQGKKPRND
jgi:periplasmic protein CpxP/Spy